MGDVLLTGTQRRFPINWLTITGYLFLSAIQYLVFAPVYWFCLLRNVRRLRADSMKSQNDNGDKGQAKRGE